MDIQQFETITVQGLEVPLAAALSRAGRPAPLAGDVEPGACNHLGASWSASLDLRCASCGAAMFLPPRVLAFVAGERIEAMRGLWRAAGCPPWYPASVGYPNGAWGIVPKYWRVVDAVGFGQLGGLPVRLAQWARFELARREFEL